MGSSGGSSLGTVVGSVGGGLLGSAFGPAGIALGATAGGALGGMFDSARDAEAAADAAERAGNKQEAAQLRQQAAAMKAAEATPEELAQLEQSIALNERDLARKEKLIASSDPAMIEAGQQALKMLQGQEAATLAPIRAQRDRQKAQLINQLRQRLGPGAEESAAGQRALAEFDAATNAQLTGAQDQALGRLLGVAQDTSGRYGIQQNLQNSLGIAQGYGNIQGRQVNALTGNPVGANVGAEMGALMGVQAGQQQRQAFMGLLGTGLNAYATNPDAFRMSRPTPSPAVPNFGSGLGSGAAATNPGYGTSGALGTYNFNFPTGG